MPQVPWNEPAAYRFTAVSSKLNFSIAFAGGLRSDCRSEWHPDFHSGFRKS
jgi:hypothetical protein